MKKKRRHSRREFMEGALAAGAAFAFARLARGEQDANNSLDLGTPLMAERIPQPDDGFCGWVGFSPVNDQAAFVSGAPGQTGLYVSRVGQPESFDVLWKPSADLSAINACAWSPNGREIAFLVRQVNNETVPKSSKISIYVADVGSRAVREPVIILETVGQEKTKSINASYEKGLAWWNDACICVPADKAAGVLKFDTHTGQSEILIPAQDDMTISSVALTRVGELRFVRAKGLGPGNGGRFLLCGMAQDGSIHDYADLTQQFGVIFSAHLSQDGEFVFVEKHDPPAASTPMLQPTTGLIYKIETGSVIGRISLVVHQNNDMYTYLPLVVRNDNELILMEAALLAADGGGKDRNMQIRVVKKVL